MKKHQFEQEVVGLQDNMYHFALSLTANPDDAEDLLQDTTLKVLGNRDKFVDNVNLKGWILTIMRNLFINNYHKVVRKQTMIDKDADLYNLDIFSESLFDSPDGSFEMGEINNAIDKLGDDLRIPFSLFLSGYKYHEIAKKMNMPIGTIKSRIFFARKELQVRLSDYKNV